MKEKKSFPARVFLATVAGFCLGLVLVACGTSNDNSTANSNASGNTSNNTRTSAPPPTTSASPATTTASTGGTTGVPVCDEYIEKYEKCLNDKVPEAARAQLRTSLETTRKAW